MLPGVRANVRRAVYRTAQECFLFLCSATNLGIEEFTIFFLAYKPLCYLNGYQEYCCIFQSSLSN